MRIIPEGFKSLSGQSAHGLRVISWDTDILLLSGLLCLHDTHTINMLTVVAANATALLECAKRCLQLDASAL